MRSMCVGKPRGRCVPGLTPPRAAGGRRWARREEGQDAHQGAERIPQRRQARSHQLPRPMVMAAVVSRARRLACRGAHPAPLRGGMQRGGHAAASGAAHAAFGRGLRAWRGYRQMGQGQHQRGAGGRRLARRSSLRGHPLRQLYGTGYASFAPTPIAAHPGESLIPAQQPGGGSEIPLPV